MPTGTTLQDSVNLAKFTVPPADTQAMLINVSLLVTLMSRSLRTLRYGMEWHETRSSSSSDLPNGVVLIASLGGFTEELGFRLVSVSLVPEAVARAATDDDAWSDNGKDI